MTGFFVQPTGSYYEGDRAHALDVAVPQRPSALHKWDFPTVAWVLDAAAQADVTRLAAIDNNITTATYGAVQPATRDQLKAMNNADYGAWFDANFATNAQLVALLKALTRIIIRRVL